LPFFAEINQGPMAIYRCFMKEHADVTTPKDLDDIQRTFTEFFDVCFECLQKHGEFKEQRELHNSMVAGYNKAAEELVNVRDIQIAAQME
jgi:hypothetical protein